jgi:hypothetical protein
MFARHWAASVAALASLALTPVVLTPVAAYAQGSEGAEMRPETAKVFAEARQDITQNHIDTAITKLSLGIDGGKLTPSELGGFLYTRGYCYHEFGLNDEALADLRRASALPGLSAERKFLITDLIPKVQADQAERAKADPAVLLQGAQQDITQNHPRAAIAKLSGAIEGGKLKTSPDLGLYLLRRGHTLSQAGLAAEALADWKRILTLPNAPDNVKQAAQLSISQASAKSGAAQASR